MKKLVDKEFQIKHAAKKFEHELDRKERRLARRTAGLRAAQSNHYHSEFIQPLMDLLRKKFAGTNSAEFDKENNRWIIRIPPVFSFIRNPEATLNTIFSIVVISKLNAPYSIYFDHSQLTDLDIGASAVLDIVVFSLREEWKQRRVSYNLGGEFPRSNRLREILMAMGITKQLNIKGVTPSAQAQQFIVQFPLYRGYKQIRSELGGPQHRDKAVTALVGYLNKCLFAASTCELSEEGKRNIAKWAGEILTNAEEHSGHNRWFAIGYMAPLPVGNNESPPSGDASRIIGECQLAIFGFGDSIFESLSSPHTPEKTKEQIEALARKHTGFFRIFQSYTEKELWTLYALQDGVSRFSISPGEKARGRGTVEMVEAFHHFKSLDDKCLTEMSLVSGSSWIRFNDKYHFKPEPVEGGTRKIIAFNQKNSLEESPDPYHVRSLAGNFPGTLLTFRIFIDDRYLEKVLDKSAKQDYKE